MSRILFDPEAIRSLAMVLRDTGLTEIEIVEADSRIRLVRSPAMEAATSVPGPAPVQTVAVPAAAPVPAEDDAVPAGAIPSPMVGIVYLAPEPGAALFVSVGQSVAAGQTLLLIEAMKTFNQIKAPRAGVVTRILVASGEPVEYDQPLLVLE